MGYRDDMNALRMLLEQGRMEYQDVEEGMPDGAGAPNYPPMDFGQMPMIQEPPQNAFADMARMAEFASPPDVMPRRGPEEQEAGRRYKVEGYNPETDAASPMPMNAMRNSDTGEIINLNFGGGNNSLREELRALNPGWGNGRAPQGGGGASTKPQEKLGERVQTADGRMGRWSQNARSIVLPDGSRVSASPEKDKKELAEWFGLQKNKQELARGEADLARTNEQTAGLRAARSGDRVANSEESKKRLAAYNAGLKDISRDDKDVAAATELEASLNRWQELNDRTETGPITGRRLVSFNPDFQELKTLENKLSMNNFKPGQGAMTNFERGLIKGAGPNTLNENVTNAEIIKIMRGSVENMKDRANFRESWLQGKGSLIGADSAWQQYLEANPRYTRDEQNGRIVENPKRSDWMSHFNGGGGGGGGARPSREAAIAELKRRGKM